MSWLTSNKILYWIIAFLVVTNTATIGSVLFHKHESEKSISHQKKRKYRFRKQKHKNNEASIDRMFRNNMKLSDTQAEKFRKFRGEFSDTAKQIMYEMHLERKLFIKQLSQQPVDSLAIANTATNIGKLHTKMKLTTMQLYTKMNQECTPEQQNNLTKIFERFIRKTEFSDRPPRRKYRHKKHKRHHRHD